MILHSEYICMYRYMLCGNGLWSCRSDLVALMNTIIIHYLRPDLACTCA